MFNIKSIRDLMGMQLLKLICREEILSRKLWIVWKLNKIGIEIIFIKVANNGAGHVLSRKGMPKLCFFCFGLVCFLIKLNKVN